MTAFVAGPCPARLRLRRASAQNVTTRRPIVSTLANSQRAPSQPPKPPLEDTNVPASHKGLHDLLYSEGAETEHGSEAIGAGSTQTQPHAALFDDATWTIPTFKNLCRGFDPDDDTGMKIQTDAEDLKDFPHKIAAVYEIRDTHNTTLYVGLTRDVAVAVRYLMDDQHISKQLHTIRVKAFAFPRRSEMILLRDEWLDHATQTSAGQLPIGNDEAKNGKLPWSFLEGGRARNTSAAHVSMSVSERAIYEEKKFKLRKAMADPTLHDELVQSESQHTNDKDITRENWKKAMYDDDWSAEINAQTNATVIASGATSVDDTTAKPDTSGQIVSPFQQTPASTGAPRRIEQNVTVATVDAVLDEVRPMLLADGGNISVLEVVRESATESKSSDTLEPAKVLLQLEGACGTCPSSSTTMRMGVERVLRDAFGDAVGEIVAVPAANGAAKEASVELADSVLEEVRGPIGALGGRIQVESVASGHVSLNYVGPSKLRNAIELLLRDKLPGVHTVAFA